MPGFEPKNPDFDARVRDSFGRQKVMHTLGITIADLSPGRIVLEMAHHDALTQQHGFVHAGIVSTALDSACGYAAFSLMPAEVARAQAIMAGKNWSASPERAAAFAATAA